MVGHTGSLVMRLNYIVSACSTGNLITCSEMAGCEWQYKCRSDGKYSNMCVVWEGGRESVGVFCKVLYDYIIHVFYYSH